MPKKRYVEKRSPNVKTFNGLGFVRQTMALIELCGEGCEISYNLFQTTTLLENSIHYKQSTWVVSLEGAQYSQIAAMGIKRLSWNPNSADKGDRTLIEDNTRSCAKGLYPCTWIYISTHHE